MCRDAAKFHAAYSMPTTPHTLVVIPHQNHHEGPEEEAKTPDHSNINQLKPRIRLTCLYDNSNPCLIYVYPIVKYSISICIYLIHTPKRIHWTLSLKLTPKQTTPLFPALIYSTKGILTSARAIRLLSRVRYCCEVPNRENMALNSERNFQFESGLSFLKIFMA